jgi:hypothetical protein
VRQVSNSMLMLSSLSLQSTHVSEEILEENHIVVPIEINNDFLRKTIYALVDCGATGYAFIDEEYCRQNQIPLQKLRNSRILEVIDG